MIRTQGSSVFAGFPEQRCGEVELKLDQERIAQARTEKSVLYLRPVLLEESTLMVKNPPAMQETRVKSLGQEGPLEKRMATLVFLPGESHGQRSLAKSQTE